MHLLPRKPIHRWLLTLTAFLTVTLSAVAHGQGPLRVSIGTQGGDPNRESYGTPLSSDGRYSLFWSFASNLVPGGDTNLQPDVFVHDRVTAKVTRVNMAWNGAEANGISVAGAISVTGRFVTFASSATNLVPGGTNGQRQAFVHDRDADGNGVFDEVGGTTVELVSVDSSGAQAEAYSGAGRTTSDGHWLVLASDATNLVPGDTNGCRDVFARDRVGRTTTRMNMYWNGTAWVQADGRSNGSTISDNARYVGFFSEASNLLGPGNDLNGLPDAFIHDRDTDGNGIFDEPGYTANILASRRLNGLPAGIVEGATISEDGRYLAFYSTSSDLVVGDTNGADDVFVYDRISATVARVSVASNGAEGHGHSHSGGMLSADGRFIAFYSHAPDLVPNDVNGSTRDVFRHDRDVDEDGVFDESGAIETICVSVKPMGGTGNSFSESAEMSADGRAVGFYSDASDLVVGDGNAFIDAFVWHEDGPTTVYCVAKVNSLGCAPAIGWTGRPSLAANGTLHITANNVLNSKAGLLLWSASQASTPFGGGTLCLQIPHRTPGQNSGGTPAPGNDCSGSYSFNFSSTYMAQFMFQPGNAVNAQYWSRDPGFAPPNNIGLTNAITFQVLP